MRKLLSEQYENKKYHLERGTKKTFECHINQSPDATDCAESESGSTSSIGLLVGEKQGWTFFCIQYFHTAQVGLLPTVRFLRADPLRRMVQNDVMKSLV